MIIVYLFDIFISCQEDILFEPSCVAKKIFFDVPNIKWRSRSGFSAPVCFAKGPVQGAQTPYKIDVQKPLLWKVHFVSCE